MLKPDMARFAIYTTLASMNEACDGAIAEYLFDAHSSLMECPACLLEGFRHVNGCPVPACVAQGRAVAAAVDGDTKATLRVALNAARPFIQKGGR